MFYLGTITVTTGIAKNNANTAVPFVIPSTAKELYLQPDTSGVQFEFGVATSFATTAVRGAFLGAANAPAGPYRTGGAASIVSVFNPTGGTVNVRVYAAAAR